MEYTACFLTTCLKDVNVAAQPESIGLDLRFFFLLLIRCMRVPNTCRFLILHPHLSIATCVLCEYRMWIPVLKLPDTILTHLFDSVP